MAIPSKLVIVLAAIAAALGVTALSFMVAPRAHAQPATVEELVVVAPNVPADRQAQFSYRLSYADLDLKTVDGKASLRHRIRVTAKYVCDRLAATDNKPYTVTDCRRKAIDGAQAQASKAIAVAEARTGPFHPGPRWQPPPGAN